ncbi:NnrU family protein [Sphingomonas oleivorans]|nr:NnrU family protein [Sphingomonas oleivorans]
MAGLANLVAAMTAFVGTHFLLSHPLRPALVGRLGERPFLGLYSLVALLTFGWVILAARTAPDTPLWWIAPSWAWQVASIVMLFASMLLLGSFFGNPAIPDPTGKRRMPGEARGIFAITRHPMMWSFTIWAVVHALLWGSASNLVITSGIGILAFFGALAQDAKKKRLLGEAWREWEARTSFWPFGAQLAGRSPWRATLPRPALLAGGLILWLIATLAHGWLGGPEVGPWH